jgi:cell division protein FtsB
MTPDPRPILAPLGSVSKGVRRQEFSGLKTDQVKRMKELEAENARLRRAISDLTFDKMSLVEAAKKLLNSSRRRACIGMSDRN